MADNLEDFLRRAAERRQAKSGQRPAAPPAAAPVRPEYTNSRTERVPKAELVDEVPLQAILLDESDLAETVPQHVLTHQVERARMQKARKQKKGVGTVKPVEPPPAVKSVGETTATANTSGYTGAPSPDAVAQLLQLIKRPGGLTQAILMNEILTRPEHRW